MSNDHDDVHGQPELQPMADPLHGTWIRVQVGPSKYLGRVYQLDFEDPYALEMPQPKGGPKTVKKESCSARAVLEAKVITLMPAYELSVSIQRVPAVGTDGKPVVDLETKIPQFGMSREPIIAGIDFNVHSLPLHIKTAETAIYVFSQTHRNDQATLHQFCKHAEERNRQHREEALA